MKRTIAALGIVAILIALPDGRSQYDQAADKTVWLEVGDGTGTGVFVDDHLILTAHHVIAGQPVIHAHAPRRENGAVVSSPSFYKQGMTCEVIATDPGKDLALLRVQGSGKPMALSRKDPSPGDPLFAIGCGDGTSLFGFASGHARQFYKADVPCTNGHFNARVIDMSVCVNLGDSGGPVVNERGELVGIISKIDAFKNQTYLAVSLPEIRAFLKSCPEFGR